MGLLGNILKVPGAIVGGIEDIATEVLDEIV